MKETRVYCDHCNADMTNGEYIEVGSDDGESFRFSDRINKPIFSHLDLHFCNKEHFIAHFFGDEPEPKPAKQSGLNFQNINKIELEAGFDYLVKYPDGEYFVYRADIGKYVVVLTYQWREVIHLKDIVGIIKIG